MRPNEPNELRVFRPIPPETPIHIVAREGDGWDTTWGEFADANREDPELVTWERTLARDGSAHVGGFEIRGIYVLIAGYYPATKKA